MISKCLKNPRAYLLFFIAIFSASLFTSSFADAKEAGFRVELHPLVCVGARLGRGSSSDKATTGYLAGKMSFLRVGDIHNLSFINPGLGIQTNGRFNVNFSPITYTHDSGLSVGFDLILPRSNTHGSLGLFIGYEFLN